MVRVDARHGFNVGNVVVYITVLQLQRLHRIVVASRVKGTAAQCGPSQVGINAHRVARHLQVHLAAFNIHLLHRNVPFRLALGSILFGRVAQCYINVGIVQTGMVQVNEFFFPVHAVCGRCQFARMSLNASVRNVAFCVNNQSIQFKTVHIGPSLKQRHEFNVQPQTVGIEQRVALFNGSHVVYGQVEWKGQSHFVNAHVHAQVARQVVGHLVHSKVLHGGYV